MANGTLTFDWVLLDSNSADCLKMKVAADGGLEGGVGNRCSGLTFEVPAAGERPVRCHPRRRCSGNPGDLSAGELVRCGDRVFAVA